MQFVTECRKIVIGRGCLRSNVSATATLDGILELPRACGWAELAKALATWLLWKRTQRGEDSSAAPAVSGASSALTHSVDGRHTRHTETESAVAPSSDMETALGGSDDEAEVVYVDDDDDTEDGTTTDRGSTPGSAARGL